MINKLPFTAAEDRIILEGIEKIGKKWSKISKLLNGRPENMVKNRFYSHIKKNYDIEKTSALPSGFKVHG